MNRTLTLAMILMIIVFLTGCGSGGASTGDFTPNTQTMDVMPNHVFLVQADPSPIPDTPFMIVRVRRESDGRLFGALVVRGRTLRVDDRVKLSSVTINQETSSQHVFFVSEDK